MIRQLTFITLILGLGNGSLFAEDHSGAVAKNAIPAPKIDFAHDVLPILKARCAECHTDGSKKGGLSMDTQSSLIDSGVVEPGNSGESELLRRITSSDTDERMPPEKKGPLPPQEIAALKAWIDQGLPWQEGFSFKSKSYAAQLAPRRPELPPASGATGEHPIDRLLAAYYKKHGIQPAEPVSDRRFARRVWFDLIGLPPSAEEIAALAADPNPLKYEQRVHRLLNQHHAYAVHWLSFWNDALRNDYRGPGYIDGGRQQITGWLYRALAENMPYDEFVRKLVTPASGAEGFTKGIVWRGVVNASQKPPMQAAQNISQVFLGINLKCASCHNSFINEWELKDAYQLAEVFSSQPLEIHRCNKPIGEFVEPAFLYEELGSIDPEAPPQQRRQQLAAFLTSRENGRFARTIVNRIWARMLGRGLVEPVDEMDNRPWSEELLDWLAADLADHGYDLKRTIALIATSRAYRLPSVGMPEPDVEDFTFRGPLVEILSAEQFIDSVSEITGVWQQVTPEMEKGAGRGQSGQLRQIRSAMQGSKLGVPPQKEVRAALADLDPLSKALGRPGREQVVTHRDSVATTLQMLELTNGDTLNRMLKEGAANWLQEESDSPERLVSSIYTRALAREPTDDELAIGIALIGEPPTAEGVQDLLWSIIMLPEYQLIY